MTDTAPPLKARDIIVRPISRQDAERFIRIFHYSGKFVRNSQVHLGVFHGPDAIMGGVMSFGPSLDKRKLQGLVRDTPWNGFIELNRMAFANWLPRNSESRALGIALRMLRKQYPFLQWVVSFADATQCGDGTIYRAAGFALTGIKRNTQVWIAPDGMETYSRTSLTDGQSKGQQAKAKRTLSRMTATKAGNILDTGASSMKAYKDAGWRPLAGFQLRYIFFLDPTARARITVPLIPFIEITKRGAGMYKGQPKHASVV